MKKDIKKRQIKKYHFIYTTKTLVDDFSYYSLYRLNTKENFTDSIYQFYEEYKTFPEKILYYRTSDEIDNNNKFYKVLDYIQKKFKED